MNEIRFDIQYNEFGNVVVPIIDGKSLISVLKEFELPFAKKEGYAKLAGAYDGLPIELVRPPTEYYIGKTGRRNLDKKIAILDCECLCGGCWSFVAKIEVEGMKIIWKDFEQIHRKNWSYKEFGVFEFQAKQYQLALMELEGN